MEINKNKIALLIDDNLQYLSIKTREIMDSWGFKPSEYKTLTSWKIGSGNMSSLFGKPKAIHLNLMKKEDFKDFADLYKSDKKFKESFNKSNWFGAGLVITISYKKGTKFIEDIVNKSNGVIFKNFDPKAMKEEILSTVPLRKDLKEFLSDYVGDNYENLFNCVKSINALPKEDVQKITIEDLIVYLPTKKGAVAPWEVVNNLVKLDLPKTLDILRRTLDNTHELVVLTFLRKKIEDIYNNKILYETGITSYKERAEILGINVWANKGINTFIEKLSLETAEKLVYYIYSIEDGFKGGETGLPSDSKLSMELVVSKILVALKYNIKP